jgi:hypothetical protein
MEVPMIKFFAVLVCIVLISQQSKAEEIEMELKISHGLTEREYHISDTEATFMQCVFQAPIIASKFINDNLVGQWIIRRITCGPPRRSM